VLNESLNTGAAHVVKQMGNQKFADYVRAFGLGEETGIDVEYLRSGSLHLARSEKEVEAMKKRAAQDDLEWLSREEAQKREPALSPSIHGALYVPGDYQVNNPRLVQALAKGAILHGAEFIQGAPVIDITREGSRVTGVKTSYETINGGYVVISAGCWSGQIGALIGWAIPVEPARGQMVVTEALPPLIRHVIWSDDFYLVPRATGEILMGSTVEFVGFDKRVTLEGMSQLTQEGINIVPSLKGHSFVRAWAGLRPYSQTRSPILGPVPGLEQVAIASGHFRNGILLGLITGKLMKELIVDNRPSISLEPFYLEV